MIESILFVLPVAVTVGVPLYIYYRERMSKKKGDRQDRSRKRVFKLTAINLLLNTAATVYFFIIFLLIIASLTGPIGTVEFSLSILFMLIVGITYYGNGIYITSIVLEDYTLPDLRKAMSYKTQFIATHLFHGPISHILIYCGWLYIFLTLAVLDIASGGGVLLRQPNMLFASGLFVGVVYAVAQIYNGTVPYQSILGFVATVILHMTIVIKGISIWSHPLGLFFFGLLISFELLLLFYLILFSLRRGSIDWDRSGY